MTHPRVLRPVPDPLGCYLRPGRNDHKVLLQMLVDGANVGTGLVADPVLRVRQADLMSEARRLGVETVLDPRTVDLSTPGGVSRSGVTDLPWAGPALHTPQLLAGPAGRMLSHQIAATVERDGYSAVLAPTHAIDDLSDPWVRVDQNLTHTLRAELNALGLHDVLIYYPLVTRSAALLSSEARELLAAALSGLPIDAVWLRLHPFGTPTAGPLALRRYLETCRALHGLGLPLVAEHSGTVGVALLAFGAVGGIESGITLGEHVDLTTMLRAPKPDAKPFTPAPRVYLHAIGAFVDVDAAAGLFEARGMSPSRMPQHPMLPTRVARHATGTATPLHWPPCSRGRAPVGHARQPARRPVPGELSAASQRPGRAHRRGCAQPYSGAPTAGLMARHSRGRALPALQLYRQRASSWETSAAKRMTAPVLRNADMNRNHADRNAHHERKCH
jgi:hypothetical protein